MLVPLVLETYVSRTMFHHHELKIHKKTSKSNFLKRKQLNATVENGELADATLRLASLRLRGVT